MIRIVFIVSLLVLVIPSFGQLSDSVNYYLKYASTGVVNSTNDRDAFVLNNALRFSYQKKNISLNTSNSWVYGEQQRVVTNNDFSSSLDFDLFKKRKHIYYWGLLTYEKSLSLKVASRFQGGFGIGYYLLDRENFVIQLSDGILYEYSHLVPQESIADPEYDTYRNSLRLKFRVIFKGAITVDGVDFIQHALSDRKDYIVRSNTNVSVKLYKWISVTVSLAYNKLNATKRENFLLNYGLTVEKYF